MESAGGVLVAAPAGRAVDLVRASQWIKRRNAPPKALVFQCRLLAMTPWLRGRRRAAAAATSSAAASPRAPELHRDRRGPEPNFSKMESAGGGPSGSRCRPRARESMDKEEERGREGHSDGHLVRVFSTNRSAKFRKPRGLRFDPDNNLYCVAQDEVVAFNFINGKCLGSTVGPTRHSLDLRRGHDRVRKTGCPFSLSITSGLFLISFRLPKRLRTELFPWALPSRAARSTIG